MIPVNVVNAISNEIPDAVVVCIVTVDDEKQEASVIFAGRYPTQEMNEEVLRRALDSTIGAPIIDDGEIQPND